MGQEKKTNAEEVFEEPKKNSEVNKNRRAEKKAARQAKRQAKQGGNGYPLPRAPQGQLFDPAALQKAIAEHQQEILQTPAAKRRNRDAEDPFKNGFFKTNEQRREVEQKYSSKPMIVYKGKEEPPEAPQQTPAQKLFAPAKPKEQPNDPAAVADYRARMDKHRQNAQGQTTITGQAQKSVNQGAMSNEEYAATEAKAELARQNSGKRSASSPPTPQDNQPVDLAALKAAADRSRMSDVDKFMQAAGQGLSEIPSQVGTGLNSAADSVLNPVISAFRPKTNTPEQQAYDEAVRAQQAQLPPPPPPMPQGGYKVQDWAGNIPGLDVATRGANPAPSSFTFPKVPQPRVKNMPLAGAAYTVEMPRNR